MDCNSPRNLGLGIDMKRENGVEFVTSPATSTTKQFFSLLTWGGGGSAEAVKCVFSLKGLCGWLKLKPLL